MREYVLTFLVTAAVTYLLTPLVRRIAIRGGAMHEARDRDVHVVPIPLLGGLAMYGGLAAGLLVASLLTPLNADVLTGTDMGTGLLLAGGLIVVIGMVDDRWGMNVISKLAGQVAAGAILVASGCKLGWLPMPGGGILSPTSNQATVLTILVIVATINAVNFIDGLDGLAAGIVAIAAVSFFLYYYSLTHVLRISAEAGPALASAVLAGMCVGFLPHNFFPARIFMGDTGSMLLGLLLAYAPISSIASLDPKTLAGTVDRFPEILPLLLPTAIMVIPYADMLMAVVRRTRAGMSPFAPDRKHLHHRLLDIGHSHRLSVLIMYLWAAMFSGLIVWFSTAKTPLFVFGVITLAAVLALLLMSMPRLRWWQQGRRPELAPAIESAPASGSVLAGEQVFASAPVVSGAPVVSDGAVVSGGLPAAQPSTSPAAQANGPARHDGRRPAAGRDDQPAPRPDGRPAAVGPSDRPAAPSNARPAAAWPSDSPAQDDRPGASRPDDRPAARHGSRPGTGWPDDRPAAQSNGRPAASQPNDWSAAWPGNRPAAQSNGRPAAQPSERRAAESEDAPSAGRPAADGRSGAGRPPRSVVGTPPPAVSYSDPLSADPNMSFQEGVLPEAVPAEAMPAGTLPVPAHDAEAAPSDPAPPTPGSRPTRGR